MCELMGMSFARPISADFSIREFARRDEENADGWGLAWYPDRSVAVIKEPSKWGVSQYLGFLEQYRGLGSHLYLAHVRLKTVGNKPTHADTHPFVREMGGREYCFAHNGTLKEPLWQIPLRRYRPVGSTDSEYLFCHLLDLLADAAEMENDKDRWTHIAAKLRELNRLGRLNCLFSDGQRLVCYHDINGWKGLNLRQVSIRDNENRRFEDANIQVDLAGQPINYGIVVATAPLSVNGWRPFRPGEFKVLENGDVVYSSISEETSAATSAAAMNGHAKGAEQVLPSPRVPTVLGDVETSGPTLAAAAS